VGINILRGWNKLSLFLSFLCNIYVVLALSTIVLAVLAYFLVKRIIMYIMSSSSENDEQYSDTGLSSSVTVAPAPIPLQVGLARGRIMGMRRGRRRRRGWRRWFIA